MSLRVFAEDQGIVNVVNRCPVHSKPTSGDIILTPCLWQRALLLYCIGQQGAMENAKNCDTVDFLLGVVGNPRHHFAVL